MRVILYDPFFRRTGPEWMVWVAVGLFLLVLTVCTLLVVRFNRRDARIRAVVSAFWHAREQFMSAAEHYEYSLPSREAFSFVVQRGMTSIQAYRRAHVVAPELEPDGDWLNSLRWVTQKAKQLGLRGGQ